MESTQNYRKGCFRCRQKMISDDSLFQFWVVMLSGILFITGPWISIIIVYDKYFDLHDLLGHSKEGSTPQHHNSSKSNNLTFSDAVIPLIVMQSTIIFIVATNCYNLLKEVFRYGILSWHRDNFGAEIQVLSFHICLLITWCNL